MLYFVNWIFSIQSSIILAKHPYDTTMPRRTCQPATPSRILTIPYAFDVIHRTVQLTARICVAPEQLEDCVSVQYFLS